MKFKRIFLIVLDSLGIGGAPDAKDFDDEGANTLLHILQTTKIGLPNLRMMGLFNLVGKADIFANSYYLGMREASNGKDTLTGHLEMMGIETTTPFLKFTEHGFPDDLIAELERLSGRQVIGNRKASGTEIIDTLGVQHIKTGSLIVYTSTDSVMQIAAHESIVPVKELYRICEIARKLTMRDEWRVGRVIARPFNGKPHDFTRTANRRDYALDPSEKTTLDFLIKNKEEVITIGKISDIFNGWGISKKIPIEDNLDGIEKIIDVINSDFSGLCFANLNDFDSKYGHRRDAPGYANALKEFDNNLYRILDDLKDDDMLMITADHGNDPSYYGTDHTRENIPLLIYSKSFIEPKRLPDSPTFGDIGATISDNFGVSQTRLGKSLLEQLK